MSGLLFFFALTTGSVHPWMGWCFAVFGAIMLLIEMSVDAWSVRRHPQGETQ